MTVRVLLELASDTLSKAIVICHALTKSVITVGCGRVGQADEGGGEKHKDVGRFHDVVSVHFQLTPPLQKYSVHAEKISLLQWQKDSARSARASYYGLP